MLVILDTNVMDHRHVPVSHMATGVDPNQFAYVSHDIIYIVILCYRLQRYFRLHLHYCDYKLCHFNS